MNDPDAALDGLAAALEAWADKYGLAPGFAAGNDDTSPYSRLRFLPILFRFSDASVDLDFFM